MARNRNFGLLTGFVAGFLATLAFHQLAVGLLWLLGMGAAPYAMAATWPLGVPAVFSLAFWGGIWGMIFQIAQRHFPRRSAYWIAAFLFGGILPSLVALFVVFPLKGRPVGGGWHPAFLARVFFINGIWGWGTGLILKALKGK